ncbi:TIGR03013 family XrtA/PEP-CTERM system glycosyltransferase [Qipengyuania sp. MTN3-11]|uniref:TIGR03013 family XrtA/PEP-CTERM system glycosyltransferase n=1 Tax=Qipengyuania sp. MTN3-11 TaxID=3056557 RepID=UPI0036F2DE13
MIRMFKHYIPYAVMVLALVDIVLLLLAVDLAWRMRTYQIATSPGDWRERIAELCIFAGIVFTAMAAVGSYSVAALQSMRFAIARLLVAVSLGVIGISILDLMLPGELLWRSILLYAMLFAIALLIGNRLLLGPMLGTSRFQRRILVLGAGARARRLADLAKKPGSGFVITSFVAMSDAEIRVDRAVLRHEIDDLGLHVDRTRAGEVVLALEERRNALPLKDLLRIKTRGVYVNDFSSFIERETGRVDLDTLNPSWLIFSDGFSSGRLLSSGAKRTFDVVVSLALLVITAPVILLFALLVRLESPGSPFFRQKRIGLYGEPFVLTKLRSMRQDAEAGGAQWAQKDDPRVTRIGRFIRKVRIDELPQCWNVLKGEMSFVGPRPERPNFVAELESELPYYAERHMVKPGITGWAQINFPYGASIEDSREKLEYDLYYAKNYTPFLDLLILLQTLRVILWPEGAR